MNKEFKIGVFAIVMICSAWAGVKFFSGIDIFSRNVEYKAEYEQIGGIQAASSIMIRGVKVGTVTDISFDPTVDENVQLALTIQRKYRIPKDSKAKIANNGLMGGKIIDITLGQSSEYLEAGELIPTIEEVDLFASAGSEFETLKVKLETLNQEMVRTLGNINTMLESNNSHINGMLANLEGLSGNLNSVLSSNKSNIGVMLEGMSEFAETLGNNSQRMDSIMLNLAGLSAQLNDANIGENLGATIEELNKTLAQLNSAEGSVGKLLTDEGLYNNLTSATSSLDSLFIDLRENPKRYVHFSLFGGKSK